MDFVGDEDAVRYAMAQALHAHTEELRGPPHTFLPSANVARTFLKALEDRGWCLTRLSNEAIR